MLVSNISTGAPTLPMIQVALDSHLNLNNVTYQRSTAPFFNVLASSGNIKYFTAKDLTLPTFFLKFEQTTNATLSNWVLYRITVVLLIPITFSDAYIHSIENMDFNDAFATFFYVLRSRINSINNMVAVNTKAGPLLIQNSQIGMLSNSRFENNGWTYPLIAAVYSQDSKI